VARFFMDHGVDHNFPMRGIPKDFRRQPEPQVGGLKFSGISVSPKMNA